MITARCIKKGLLPALLLFAAIHPLSACSRTLTVEPDTHDPNLHGQVVRFTVPVVYMEFNKDDKKDFDDKSISVGRLLTTEDRAQSLYNYDETHVTQKVREKMSFTILESFWVRHDWFTREFAPDVDMLVLEDEDGIISVCLRYILVHSNRPELGQDDK